MSSKRSRKRRRAAAKRRPVRSSASDEQLSAATDAAAAQRTEGRYTSRGRTAPLPLWAPWPLTELMIGGGIILALLGFALASGARQQAMIGGGLLFIALASTELAWREHTAGYRSHTTLLAALTAFLVAGICWLLWRAGVGIPRVVLPVVWLVVFALAAWPLRDLFKRRSGGVGFRV